MKRPPVLSTFLIFVYAHSLNEVPSPRAVRYAYRNAPAVGLFNEAGLPAAPFRTDMW
jgi:hypothetical protein